MSKHPCTIIPLTTNEMTLLAKEASGLLLWHLHANNLTPDPVKVEIHQGDTNRPAIETLIITLNLAPYGSDSVPTALSKISFDPGTALYAKASAANKANVVINTEVR